MTARTVSLPGGRLARKPRPYWPAATGHPDPSPPDPGRMDRLRLRAGVLIAAEIAASIRDAEHGRWARALAAIEGTLGGGDARSKAQIPADDAGEFVLLVDNHPIAHLRAKLSWRQHRALEHMAELYGKGGGRRVWAQPGGGAGPDNAHAAEEYRDLEAAAGQAWGYQVRTLCAGDWPLAPWITLDGLGKALDRVANRLRLEKEKKPDG